MVKSKEYGWGGQKLASISAIRFVAMLLIIACHILQYYDIELCFYLNVGVQIFFVISGFLYGNKEIDNPISFIRRNFKKILVPYFVFLAISVVVYGIMCPSQLKVPSLLLSICCAGTLPGLGHLWFVGYILFCYLLTPYLFRFKQLLPQNASLKKVFFYYTCVLFLFQVLGFAFRSYFMPPFVACYLIGFLMADMYRRFGNKILCYLLLLFVPLAFITNLIEVYVKYVFKPELNDIQQYALSVFSHYGHMFLGLALFLIMFFLFKKACYSNLLRLSDKYSYYVYLVHQLFILSPLSLMETTPFVFINIFIVFCAIVAAALILYIIVENLNIKYSLYSQRNSI